jgi:hypothetical protein
VISGAGQLTKTPTPFATGRSAPPDGWLRTATPSTAPGGRATSVEDPPPSRLKPSVAPRLLRAAATPAIVRPLR